MRPRIPRIVLPSDMITTLPIIGTDAAGKQFPLWISDVSITPTRRLRAEAAPDGKALVLTPSGTHKRGIVVTVWSGDTASHLRVVLEAPRPVASVAALQGL
jgi:hypothetical protein